MTTASISASTSPFPSGSLAWFSAPTWSWQVFTLRGAPLGSRRIRRSLVLVLATTNLCTAPVAAGTFFGALGGICHRIALGQLIGVGPRALQAGVRAVVVQRQVVGDLFAFARLERPSPGTTVCFAIACLDALVHRRGPQATRLLATGTETQLFTLPRRAFNVPIVAGRRRPGWEGPSYEEWGGAPVRGGAPGPVRWGWARTRRRGRRPPVAAPSRAAACPSGWAPAFPATPTGRPGHPPVR